jgi:GDSL-like Lipase/Acylhydrolase family
MRPLHPDLVTVTMGGNNVGFAPIIATCFIANCDGALAAGYIAIREFSRHVANVYRSIKAAAPSARIVVVGYPRLFPKSQVPHSCTATG